MAAKNKYILRSNISDAKSMEFARLLCANPNATRLAKVTGLNRNTRLLTGIRERMAAACIGRAWLRT